MKITKKYIRNKIHLIEGDSRASVKKKIERAIHHAVMRDITEKDALELISEIIFPKPEKEGREPEYENQAKALLGMYNVMDDHSSPYFQDWTEITKEEGFDDLVKLLKDEA